MDVQALSTVSMAAHFPNRSGQKKNMDVQALSTVSMAATSKCMNQLNSSYRGPQFLHTQWIGSNPIKITTTLHPNNNFKPFVTKHCPIKANVSFSLPTAKPESAVSTEKIPKWSSKAIKSFAMGELEARKLKYPTTGTEALLMGILIEGTSHASKYLRANGITLFKVRDEIVKVLGKADLYFFSPEHPPLTETAQKALDWALDEKLKSGDHGAVTTTHLLLGLWAQQESAGYKVLSTLGFNDEKAQELKNVISDPGFVER